MEQIAVLSMLFKKPISTRPQDESGYEEGQYGDKSKVSSPIGGFDQILPLTIK